MSDSDDWGDWSDGGDMMEAEGELSVEDQISNLFFEGEDVLLSDPATAMEKFRELVDLWQKTRDSGEPLNDESTTNMFSSLCHLLVLLIKQSKPVTEVLSRFQHLLDATALVTRNETAAALSKVFDSARERENKFQEDVYSFANNFFTQNPNVSNTRFRFELNMRRCKELLDAGQFDNAADMIDLTHKSCQLPDGSDDVSRPGDLLAIYATKLQLCDKTNNRELMALVFERTNCLQASSEARYDSIIKECWGKMQGKRGEWVEAYENFKAAFQLYDEMADRNQAKRCLLYVGVANLLSEGVENPFTSREVKNYLSDPTVMALAGLRSAFDACDVRRFKEASDILVAAGDEFINEQIKALFQEFYEKALFQIMRGYRRVYLSWLAAALLISPSRVEHLLVRLILRGTLNGKIDQVKGVFFFGETEGIDQHYAALQTWIGHIQHGQGPKVSEFPGEFFND